ncbi:MAG: AraC family transcriptional regulator ligand-binding domain-containing protein [Comamonadaceae bacterium]|nr:AraC family transcriptional regulator ligand-binding domain-containing protein [Comamonadaceae bacterium]
MPTNARIDRQTLEEVNPHWDLPTVHPVYLRLCFQTLRSHGVDVAPLLVACGLGSWDVLMRQEAYVSYRVIHQLIQEILKLNLKPDLALDFGASVQVSAHGPLGFAVVCSRDLRQALQTLERYTSLRSANFKYRFTEDGGGFHFEVVELIARRTWPRERDFFSALMLSLITRMVEAVCGPHLERFTLDIPFPQPVWHGAIRRIFPGTIRFDSPSLVFNGDTALLDIPCATADPAAYAQACQDCDRLIEHAGNASLSTRIRSLLAGRSGTYPAMVQVADFFHMSGRTLARKLVVEGTSYQILLDEVRQQKALWYLEQTSLRMEDIAERLGYENVSSFSRACRRWFGRFPSEVRKSSDPSSPEAACIATDSPVGLIAG